MEMEDSVSCVVDVSGKAMFEEIVPIKCCIEVPNNICIQHLFQTNDSLSKDKACTQTACGESISDNDMSAAAGNAKNVKGHAVYKR